METVSTPTSKQTFALLFSPSQDSTTMPVKDIEQTLLIVGWVIIGLALGQAVLVAFVILLLYCLG